MEIQDQNCTLQFEQVYQLNRSADDMVFDQIIAQLQEILISNEFEHSLSAFMRTHWGSIEGGRKEKELQVFGEYSQQMKIYLQNNIRRKVPEFAWGKFNELVKSRKNIVDEQIMDTLLSLEDLEHFKAFIRDYRSSFEEEEMLKVLTVKGNKASELKKVKGRNNIFAEGENLRNDLFEKGLKGTTIKRKPAQEKTEDELLVPNLLLTIKPLRKK